MSVLKVTDAEFVALVEKWGMRKTARLLGAFERNVFQRRRNLERKLRRPITPPGGKEEWQIQEYPGRLEWDIENGIVLIGSDAHFWPNIRTTAFRAFVHFCKTMKPTGVILNGDLLDGASISRHPPIGWESQPSVIEELETLQDRLAEVEGAAPKAKKAFPLGNHDARFETRLATVAPEYAKVHGFHLKDHVSPQWEPCWSVWISDQVIVKHRFRSGIHAPHNNATLAGRSIVTGHLHSAKVQPVTDMNGTRYGVDAGCLADTFGPQFEYLEDNPRPWRSGFAVLTFADGELLYPELCTVRREGVVDFRGKLIKV